jgi:hypothetical protein
MVARKQKGVIGSGQQQDIPFKDIPPETHFL